LSASAAGVELTTGVELTGDPELTICCEQAPIAKIVISAPQSITTANNFFISFHRHANKFPSGCGY
jgi:hypothetical protein